MTAATEIQLNTEAQYSDLQLIEGAQRGSVDAFGEIVRRYQLDVRWFLCSKLHDLNAVDDLAQEVFVGAMKQIQDFQHRASLRSWLIAIAHKKYVDYVRFLSRSRIDRSMSVENLLYRDTLAIESEAVDTAADHSRMTSRLADCIRELKPRGQLIVRKFYFEDQSAEQIARDLHQKAGTVRMALLRVRRALAKCIKAKIRTRIES